MYRPKHYLVQTLTDDLTTILAPPFMLRDKCFVVKSDVNRQQSPSMLLLTSDMQNNDVKITYEPTLNTYAQIAEYITMQKL